MLWSILVGTSLAWNIWLREKAVTDIAKIEAEAFINKDLALRSWASSHGGVYVKPTQETPPNPYLDAPNRDVITTGGQQLTLMNPAYITREVHSRFAKKFDVYGHMTSLQLKNPVNAPSDWEREGLQRFAAGHLEDYIGFSLRDGKPYLDLIKPMLMEESCLACHAWTQIPVGGVRGGIVASVPLAPLWEKTDQVVLQMALSHGGFWIIGMAAIGWIGSKAKHIKEEREQSESERQELYIQATHDPLTGLYNRRYLNEILPREVYRAKRSGTLLSLAMLDIDHFKRYNDEYGHQAGDAVLRALGQFLRENLRQCDIPCRYGGEEILIIMPYAKADEAQSRLQKLFEEFHLKPLAGQTAPLPPVTVSVGVAEYWKSVDQDTEQFLSQTDQALYRAKAAGRNRIVIYHTEGAEGQPQSGIPT